MQELLKACGRSHTLQDVYKAVEAIQGAGVASWSLDLISGLPHLTPAAWEHSLREAIRLQPDHVSVYDLQVRAYTVSFAMLFFHAVHFCLSHHVGICKPNAAQLLI